MLAIALKEFTNLFKSIKSIIVILMIFSATIGIAKLLKMFQTQLKAMGLGDNPNSVGLLLIIFIFGPIFVFILSHNIVNDEMKSRTIRFLVTKTTRNNIIIGKFLGVLAFWFIILFITIIILALYTKSFYFIDMIHCITFLSYFIALALLLSVIIDNPVLSNFIGLALSIIISGLGFWSILSEKLFLKLFSYLTPYYFLKHDNGLVFCTLIHTLILLMISLLVFKRRDL
ncbi:ABC transporter permease subunit [Macrococcus equi]|uniref:ABC transporter permease subunit n=1 Tax=Macrococcus equi TaxID=3395462 RepID=UPI0039BE8144